MSRIAGAACKARPDVSQALRPDERLPSKGGSSA
jgi:hypothetical protein